ncbi:MAG: type II toxin-antitoxin system RelB/DinJ family antitoxin [Calditrichia bacterium]
MSSNKNTVVRARIDSELKQDVESILNTMGLNVSDAISLLFNMIRLHNGIPFEVKIPVLKPEVIETFKKTDANEDLEEFETIDDLRQSIKKW